MCPAEDPVVLFKGGTGAPLILSEATLDQNTILYVKNAPAVVAVAGGGGGLSGAAIAGEYNHIASRSSSSPVCSITSTSSQLGGPQGSHQPP